MSHLVEVSLRLPTRPKLKSPAFPYGVSDVRFTKQVELETLPKVGERFLGSVRRECLDHIVVLGEAHLRRVLREYVAYFNQDRPHQGIRQRADSVHYVRILKAALDRRRAGSASRGSGESTPAV